MSKITINTKTYDLPNELITHLNQQQRILDTLTQKAEDFRQSAIHWKAQYEQEYEKSKHKTIAIDCYVTECKHHHEDLYCANPHGMSIQVCSLGVPQCEGYEDK